ncbi:MAG TPA: hypothetical protein V6D09_10275 [Leptolyngbyaceae cyanobacterium]
MRKTPKPSTSKCKKDTYTLYLLAEPEYVGGKAVGLEELAGAPIVQRYTPQR